MRFSQAIREREEQHNVSSSLSEQVDLLKLICPLVQVAEEIGATIYLLPQLKLPEGCVPGTVDALLCPSPHTGYNSRLFFNQQIQTTHTRRTQQPLNWNGQVRVLERDWYAFSWQTDVSGLALIQILQLHLDGLR
jgi:hypothetical protein